MGQRGTGQLIFKAATVAGGMLKVGQLAEGLDAVCRELFQKNEKHLGSDARVAGRPVAVRTRDAALSGQRVKGAGTEAGQEALGQTQGTQGGVEQRARPEPPGVKVEESQIKNRPLEGGMDCCRLTICSRIVQKVWI